MDLAPESLHPSGRALTYFVHGRQWQAQYHFIFYQIEQVDGLADQNRIAVGQCLQSLEFGFTACQMHDPIDLHRMLQGAQAALTDQPDLALYRQAQRIPAAPVSMAGDSTDQRALRKFLRKARKAGHIRLGFPGSRIPAKTPRINYDGLKHGVPAIRPAGAARTGSR